MNPHLRPDATVNSTDVPPANVDQDLRKGAVEGPDGQGNPNGTGLDDEGWPNDEDAIAQDVLGANEDNTQG